jgi:hypothetical protein
VSKTNRQKGISREKYRFVCEGHDQITRGPVRFKYEDARKDWEAHNRSLPVPQIKEGAVALLLTQQIVASI